MSPVPGNAGALLTAPAQYEIGNGTNAWLLGSGTPNLVTRVDGLFDLPDINDRDIDRQDTHGSFAGINLLKKRRIVITGSLLHDDSVSFNLTTRQQELATRLNLMRRWFQPVTSDLVLAFRRWLATAPNYKDYFCFVRPMKRAIPSDAELAMGSGAFIVEVHAPDPHIYSLAATTSVIANAATGILHPQGETASYPVYTITGPASNPVLANSDDSNRQIKIAHVQNAGDTLVIDTWARSVTLNGVAHWDYLDPGNQWHKLLPQVDNHVTFQGNNAGASCAVSYRDAWF